MLAQLLIGLLLLYVSLAPKRPTKQPPKDFEPPVEEQVLWPALDDQGPAREGRRFLVVSTVQHYSVALDYLMERLTAEWPADQIIIVVNKCDDESIERKQGKPIYIKTMRNLFEYTSFMAPVLIDAGSDDCFLMLHDTCIARPGFASLVNGIMDRFQASKSDIHWAAGRGQCNICLIRRKASEKAYSLWSRRTDMTKDEAVQLEVLLHKDSTKFWTGLVHTCERYRPRVTADQKVPYSDVPRFRIEYDTLGIDKYYGVHTKAQPHSNRL